MTRSDKPPMNLYAVEGRNHGELCALFIWANSTARALSIFKKTRMGYTSISIYTVILGDGFEIPEEECTLEYRAEV